MGYSLPTSTGDRRISAINSRKVKGFWGEHFKSGALKDVFGEGEGKV